MDDDSMLCIGSDLCFRRGGPLTPCVKHRECRRLVSQAAVVREAGKATQLLKGEHRYVEASCGC